MRTLLAMLLLIASSCSAQIMPMGGGNLGVRGGGGPSTWTLHSGVVCSNGGTGVDISCTLTGVSAGDLIAVQVGQNACDLQTVNDTVNTGNYSTVYINGSDPTDANCSSQMFFLNATAGSPVITATFISGGWNHISAQAYTDSGGGASATQDSTFSNSSSPFFSTSAGAVNANCGSAKTPSNDNELVIAYVEGDGTTFTHGTNFTALTTNSTGNPSAGQYWIQTTATSTTGAFVNTSDDWGAGCAAFKP